MKDVFFNTLTRALNRYLQLDPETQSRMNQLQNKVISIELRPLHFIFQCHIHQDKIIVTPGETLVADTTIIGTPLQLLNVILNKKQRQHFFSDDVTIQGDAEVGQLIIHLFDEIQIDWEENLSHIIGDSPAYRIGQMTRRIRHWLQKTNDQITQDITDYLHEETEWFPSRLALQDFFDDIDQLQNDVDRLAAKFSLLQDAFQKKEDEL